jgi:hypothetical protein
LGCSKSSVPFEIFIALTKYSLAIAEMTTLTAAIYRVYRTNLKVGTESISPGITSRFEVFFDETLPEMKVGHPPVFRHLWSSF